MQKEARITAHWMAAGCQDCWSAAQAGPDLPDLDEGRRNGQHSPGLHIRARRCWLIEKALRAGVGQGLGCQFAGTAAVIGMAERAILSRQLGPCCPKLA